MTPQAHPFFTLDRGTATTAAALVGPVDGRFRLLGAASVPRGVDPDVILEDLAWRAARTDAALAGPIERWREWARLEVHTTRAPRACLVAATMSTGTDLDEAFSGAGWRIGARFFGPRPDVVALGEACLDPGLDALVVGVAERPDEDEWAQLKPVWPLVVSLGSMRDDLAVIACGTFAERPEAIPDARLFALPSPEPRAAWSESALRSAARQIAAQVAGGAQAADRVDGRQAFRTAIGSLAVLLDRRVEGLEVGAAAGSRSLAHPDREVRHAVFATGSLVPASILQDEREAEDILRWSTIAGDSATLVDRLRELVLRPWAGQDEEGARLRFAALRAALWRMQRAWEGSPALRRPEEDAADVVVLSGGAVGSVPPAAAALALIDGIRRPGAVTILHDHARVLAPLGALPLESERRRLLADLMDDCLLPVGSTIVTGNLGSGASSSPLMVISSALGSEELSLEPNRLRLVDLPPGMVARLDIDPRDGSVLGVQGRRLTLEVSGGLGGLLVDTRATVLPLPDAGERRRVILAEWEQPVWAGREA